MDGDARAALGRLIEERGEDFSSLSRLIGRNPAYIQQYIRRGTPRRLAEEDRRLLARYFGVDECMLGAPEAGTGTGGGGGGSGLVAVPRLDVGASAGPGALAGGEARLGRLGFDPLWLRRLGVSDSGRLSLIRVEGDSMAPTLSAGDEILVDQGDAAGRLRDGIYVLRVEDALVVKRIARSPAWVSVRSDNPAYPSWPDCEPAALTVVGRVVWVGRALG